MTNWSFTNIRAARPTPHLSSLPPHDSGTTFSAFNFGLKFGLLFQPPKSTKRNPKTSKNPPQDPPKTYPKKPFILQHAKSSKIVPLWYENLIFDIRKAPKIVQKLEQKRYKVQLRLGSPLGTSKIRFWNLKSFQHGSPKI